MTMKFAIRDDDLNYFYTPDFIENNLSNIFDVCPVSMASIPLVKGNWKKNTEMLESTGPNGVTKLTLETIRQDTTIHNISLNRELVQYIRERVKEGRISIAIHGIHHRNEDPDLPDMSNNFAIGAEFETKLRLKEPLFESIRILEACFHQKIRVFTPPQNSYSLEGALAVFDNNLAMCAYLPGVRDWAKFVHLLGMNNYLSYLKHRLKCKKLGFYYPFPGLLRSKLGVIADHCALQPSTNTKLLIDQFHRVRDEGGNFVLSTHSYGFDFKMHNGNETMKQSLIRILDEVSKYNDVNFVSLDKIFEE